MVITIDKNLSPEEKKKAIEKALDKEHKKQIKRRLKLLKKIQGKIKFDKTGKMTAMEIQDEMRNDWT